MSTTTLTTREGAARVAAPLAPAPPRSVPARAFGRMTDAELSFLAHHSRNPRTVVAATCVLIGRETAVPPHPPCPTIGSRT